MPHGASFAAAVEARTHLYARSMQRASMIEDAYIKHVSGAKRSPDRVCRLAAEQMAAERRREEARKQAGRVDFVPGKSTTPPAGMAVGGLSSASIVANAKASASSKRSSKWDTLPGRR